MPDALLVSSELAPKKAWTAVAMKTATHELSDVVRRAPRFMARKSHLQWEKWLVTFCGGYAPWRDGILPGGLASAAAALSRTWT